MPVDSLVNRQRLTPPEIASTLQCVPLCSGAFPSACLLSFFGWRPPGVLTGTSTFPLSAHTSLCSLQPTLSPPMFSRYTQTPPPKVSDILFKAQFRMAKGHCTSFSLLNKKGWQLVLSIRWCVFPKILPTLWRLCLLNHDFWSCTMCMFRA